MKQVRKYLAIRMLSKMWVKETIWWKVSANNMQGCCLLSYRKDPNSVQPMLGQKHTFLSLALARIYTVLITLRWLINHIRAVHFPVYIPWYCLCRVTKRFYTAFFSHCANSFCHNASILRPHRIVNKTAPVPLLIDWHSADEELNFRFGTKFVYIMMYCFFLHTNTK
jgi:hypothetical protein